MTWVLLRGLARETAHWGRFPGALALALGDPVVTVDPPGNGTRHAEPAPLNVNAIVDACRNDVFRRGLVLPLDLLALSMGAMAAIQWAQRFPREIRRCVAINTSMRPYAPFHQRLRPASYAALIGAMFARDPVERERRVLAVTSARPGAHGSVLDEWAAIARLRPVRRANVVRQLVAAARFRAPAARPACGLLMLASVRDVLVDVRCSRGIAHAWCVPLVEHPWGGHDLPLDDPQWVIERVAEWLPLADRWHGEGAAVAGSVAGQVVG